MRQELGLDAGAAEPMPAVGGELFEDSLCATEILMQVPTCRSLIFAEQGARTEALRLSNLGRPEFCGRSDPPGHAVCDVFLRLSFCATNQQV